MTYARYRPLAAAVAADAPAVRSVSRDVIVVAAGEHGWRPDATGTTWREVANTPGTARSLRRLPPTRPPFASCRGTW
jgi:hypothetical protein